MTNGAREEAEKWDSGAVYSIQKEKPNMLYWVKWRDHVNQVEKARADERERCAKICDEWERNGPTHNDKFVARQLGKQIRNKPEKE